MQVTEVPTEENKAWVGGAEACGRGAEAAPASWETHPSHFGAHAGLAQRKLALFYVWQLVLGIPYPGVTRLGPAWVTQAPQSLSYFQIPEGGELRWLYFLPGSGERLGHDHGHTRPGPEAAHQALGGGGAPAGDAAVAAESRAAVHAVLAARRGPHACLPPPCTVTLLPQSAPRPGSC